MKIILFSIVGIALIVFGGVFAESEITSGFADFWIGYFTAIGVYLLAREAFS